MSGPAPILRELHRLRRFIKELETKIEQAPRNLKAQQMKIAHQDGGLNQAHEELKQFKVHIHEKEVSVKASEQQIKKYESQRNEAKSKKEYETLGSEIAQARDHIRKIEDEILELMDQLETKSRELPAAEMGAKKARDAYAQFEKDQAILLERYAADKVRSQTELQEMEKSLPEDIRQQYDRLIRAKGSDAIAGVQGTICSACYTEITPQMANLLRTEDFVLCKNCGRMLYTEGSA
jgi:predicted  nucleic acid-binding Zn-ribbon protein